MKLTYSKKINTWTANQETTTQDTAKAFKALESDEAGSKTYRKEAVANKCIT